MQRLYNGYATAAYRTEEQCEGGTRKCARMRTRARQASMKDVLMLLDDKASSEQVARTLGDLQVRAHSAPCALHTLE